MKKPIKGEVWKHYKGQAYLIVTLCKNEANLEEMVVYENGQSGVRYVQPVDRFKTKFTKV